MPARTKPLSICLLLIAIACLSLTASAQKDKKFSAFAEPRSAESSPFTVGAWKLVCDNTACMNPIVDTEFRFINPTPLTVTLEYAFFENGGNGAPATFCGCDRDTLIPNQTTVYTVSGERNNTPNPLMTCTGNSGALKSIVFANHLPDKIVIGGATQTGFQTTLFGNITVGPDGKTLYANSMAEAGMKGIEINPVTLAEISAIHQHCVNFLGPL